ncbi:cytosine deaminase [Stappia sp. GBMRC 2046]|uniref:Cytosine deaminase n=2 Tax=Stappia sediminis TaxID=2692190 RepID=A0A7X3LUE6_9HYPH|nr:cytosine deaminase [Stappia sediminis]
MPACLTAASLATDAQGLSRANIRIEGGKIAAISPSGEATPDGLKVVDADGGLVLPMLVDMHTHLDKGYIWKRAPNPDGTFTGALEATTTDRTARWNAEDVRRRMDFGLRSAYAHGTALIRTHLDSIPPQDEISWPVFQETREEWRGRIELQAVALFGIEAVFEGTFLDRIAKRVKQAGGTLGAVTYMIDALDAALDKVFRTASRHGLDLDFHVDETLDPQAASLSLIAQKALDHRFEGRIVCGHCCSLSAQTPGEVDRTLDLVARAGIGIVSLPMCNLYLQDRLQGRTPRRRGVTLLHEMKARGIPVSVASDNTRDPFYAYGDLDMLEVFAQATRILHLDHPVDDWIRTVTATPADLLGRSVFGRIDVGQHADILVLRTRDWNELLARPSGDRIVLRGGRKIDRKLPDYRELDDLMGSE